MNKKRILSSYLLFDFIAALLTWIIFMVFRRIVNDGVVFSGMMIFTPNFDYLAVLFTFPFVCIAIHYLSGIYLHPENQSKLQVIFTTLVTSILISIVVFFALLLDDLVVSYEYYYYSLFVLVVLLFIITLSFRLIIVYQINQNFKRGRWAINTIIIGAGDKAIQMAKEIKQNNYKNHLVGFVATEQHSAAPKELILGNINQLDSIITKQLIEEAIIALDEPNEQKLFQYINTLYKYNIDIRFTPRLYEILTGSARISTIGLNPLVNITQLNMPDWQVSLKRFFDILLSAISLFILSPLFIYFAYKIKKDSKGSVFYLQDRIGLYGKTFKIIKFRTMYENSENGTPKLSSADDDRITKVGRILRKYRIDELPQFWNILKGEMSIVGPRPERKYYINQIIEEPPYYCLLYKIRPGLTSWGPIKIGYSDTLEKMIERLNYDIIYMESMSLLNDFKILILTLEIIFRGKGV